MDTVQVEPFARLRTLIADDPVAVDAYFATLSGVDVVRAMFRLDEVRVLHREFSSRRLTLVFLILEQ